MASEKTQIKVWDGTRWVLVHPETSADIVKIHDTDVETFLDAVSNTLQQHEQDLGTHTSNGDIHTNATDKEKLSNLAMNAEDTYATKAELNNMGTSEIGPHIYNDDIHLSLNQQSKLSNLADDADGTYATKAEVAGLKKVYYRLTISDRDAMDLSSDNAGDSCWVLDASGDNTVESGAALYGWDGNAWHKLAEAESMDVQVNWSDLQGKPESTAQDIDDAVSFSHEHANAAVLDKFSEMNGKAAYNGVLIDTDTGNKITIGESEPINPQVGDTWYQPID